MNEEIFGPLLPIITVGFMSNRLFPSLYN
jgi:hypothetical protein